MSDAAARGLGCVFCGEVDPIGGLTRTPFVRVPATGKPAYQCDQWLDSHTVDGVRQGCKTRTMRRYLGEWADFVAGRQAELFEMHDLVES